MMTNQLVDRVSNRVGIGSIDIGTDCGQSLQKVSAIDDNRSVDHLNPRKQKSPKGPALLTIADPEARTEARRTAKGRMRQT